MNAGTLLALGLIGYGVYYYTGLGVAGNDLMVVFKGFQILGLNNFQVIFTLQNVSNATIQFNSLAADVTINGDELGNISGFQPVTIPSNSQQDIVLNFNPSYITLASTVTDMINNIEGTYTVRVKGNFNANNIPLPLDVSQVIKIG